MQIIYILNAKRPIQIQNKKKTKKKRKTEKTQKTNANPLILHQGIFWGEAGNRPT
jgi:hypothetical protein